MSLLLNFLLLFGLLLQAAPTGADESTWWFALDNEGAVIVAYNLEGEVRPLVSGDQLRRLGSWRIDHQTVLAQFENEGMAFILLKPEGARFIQNPTAAQLIPVAYAYPYVVFRPLEVSPDGQPGLLINLESAQVIQLPDLLPSRIYAPDCCRFSADGTKLRYVAWLPYTENDAQNAWFEIRERDLASASETLIYRNAERNADANERLMGFLPDADGSRWLERRSSRGDEAVTLLTQEITLEGDVQVIAAESSDAASLSVYSYWDDFLVMVPVQCAADDCHVQLRDVGGSSRQFVAPQADNGALRPLYLAEDYVILQDNQNHYLLTESDEARLLGRFDPGTLSPSYLAADGSFAILIDPEDEGRFLFWDYAAGEVRAVFEPEGEERRFLLAGTNAEYAWAVNTIGTPPRAGLLLERATGQTRQLALDGVIIEVISLDELLFFMARPPGDDPSPGIYHLDMRTGESRALLEGIVEAIGGPDLADILGR